MIRVYQPKIAVVSAKYGFSACFFYFRPNTKTVVSLYFLLGPPPLVNLSFFFVTRMIPPNFIDLGPKFGVLALLKWESPKMAKIWPGGQKTACRVAEWPPTGKLKVSRVISGYGGDMDHRKGIGDKVHCEQVRCQTFCTIAFVGDWHQ